MPVRVLECDACSICATRNQLSLPQGTLPTCGDTRYSIDYESTRLHSFISLTAQLQAEEPAGACSSLMITQVTHPRILDCYWSIDGWVYSCNVRNVVPHLPYGILEIMHGDFCCLSNAALSELRLISAKSRTVVIIFQCL